MFLEDGNWEKADDFCEQVLNIDPENSLAYIGKVMAKLHVHHQEELKNQVKPFDNNGDYKKAVRFADDKLKGELQGYIEEIKHRNCDVIYEKAIKKMSSAKVEEDYTDAISEFDKIREHKNSMELINKCEELRNEMHVNNLISQVKIRLDNAFTIFEIESVVCNIKESENILEIAELIKNAKAEYEERIIVSQELWENYLAEKSVTDKLESDISKINDICADNNRKIITLEKEKNIQRKLKNEIDSLNGQIYKANEDIISLENQLTRKNQELSGLGIFSIGAKKEVNAQITNLKTAIDKSKSELTELQQRLSFCQKENGNSMSEYDIEQNILSLKRNNEINIEEKVRIEKNAKEAVLRLESVLMKIVTDKYLAILLSTNDKSLLERILSDSRIIPVIQSNRRMLDIVQMNSFYYQLSAEIISQFKRKKGSGLDLEAIYFQACQAMENPANDADIIWAKEQFMKISGYKDSDLRVSECNIRIAGV